MSLENGKIRVERRRDGQDDQKQDRALVARVIECIPKLNHDDRQDLLGDSKLPGRIKWALTPWSKSDKRATPPKDCIPSLSDQFRVFLHIASRLPNGLDFLGRPVRLGLAEREIEDHKAFGPQLLLCDDFGDPLQTAHFLLEYVKDKWVEMDPKRHCWNETHVHKVAEVCFTGPEATVRLRTGDESEQVGERPATKASRKHFDHPYVFQLTDIAPIRSSNLIPVINYRNIADMYDYMRLGVCEPLWFLAYNPEYLYWSDKDPISYPGLDLGDLAVRGFGHVAFDRAGRWDEADPDGFYVRMMQGAMACIKDFGREFSESGDAERLVQELMTPPEQREIKDYEIYTRDELSAKEAEARKQEFKPEQANSERVSDWDRAWQRAPLIFVKDRTLHVTSCGITGRYTDLPSYTMMGKICASM